jgi:hypothetical protein
MTAEFHISPNKLTTASCTLSSGLFTGVCKLQTPVNNPEDSRRLQHSEHDVSLKSRTKTESLTPPDHPIAAMTVSNHDDCV